MNHSLPDIFQLRNNIEFSSIAQFFHTFQSAFRPWPVTTQDVLYSRLSDANDYVFETEDLERMLLETSERARLEDLLVRMLRLVCGKRFINSLTWQTHFSKEFEKKLPDQENPFVSTDLNDSVNFFIMPLDTRVHLLYLLCEWQLDEPEKFREHLETEEDAVQWRVDPIGYDKKGSTFWLFDDNRLYKESPKPKPVKKSNVRKKKPVSSSSRRSSRRTVTAEDEIAEESEDEGEWMPWKLVCASKYEWEQFPTKYAKSKNLDEQKFHSLLVNDLIPKIIPVLEEHEREIKKQEAIIHRKRSSRIMIKELEALETPGTLDFDDTEGRSRSSHRIEKKTLEKEQQELENAAKAREERLLERERRIMEREYRAMVREKHSEEPDVQPLPSPVSDATNNQVSLKVTVNEDKPKKKYKKQEKLDADGNPLPKKVKLDADGDPIPKKKRGRKPKNKDLEEESWVFDCVCGVSGQNMDDGTPMIACENCGVWQHIKCLEKSGLVQKQKSLDNITFICRKCEAEEPQQKKQKSDHELQQHAIQLPHIQSAIPSINSILPPLTNNNPHVQALPSLEAQPSNHLPPHAPLEQLSPMVVPCPVPIEATVTPAIQSAPRVQQHITTAAGILPPVDQTTTVVQSTPTVVEPAVQQVTLSVSGAQHCIEQALPAPVTVAPSAPLAPPIVTAPSAPTIQTTAPAETGVCSSNEEQTQATHFPTVVNPPTSSVLQP